MLAQKGDQGPQGTKGDKGDTGTQGPQGPVGPQGSPGISGYQIVNTGLLNLPAGHNDTYLYCPNGKKVFGGGYWTGGTAPMQSYPIANGSGWYTHTYGNGLVQLYVYAICGNVAN